MRGRDSACTLGHPGADRSSSVMVVAFRPVLCASVLVKSVLCASVLVRSVLSAGAQRTAAGERQELCSQHTRVKERATPPLGSPEAE